MFICVLDPKEVKVLVDLAMISAEGQGDLEVSKVSCLHAAVTGYAPLIYELESDCDFQKFLIKCQAVWKAVDVDKDLPKKLVSAAQIVLNLYYLLMHQIFTSKLIFYISL